MISEFPFLLPKAGSSATYDDDDDLDIERPQKEVIKIGKVHKVLFFVYKSDSKYRYCSKIFEN